MDLYKDRNVQEGDKVDVYRNLNTGNFSIRCTKTKRVLAHADTVQISSCNCHVQMKGREKTIKEKRKRVHAWISGHFVSADQELNADLTREVFYNPYITKTFVDNDLVPVNQLDYAHFEGDRVYSYQTNLLV
jgi:hypothetical protein